MVITEILKKRQHLFEVVFDDGSRLLLDKKLVAEEGLFKGQELSEKDCKALLEKSDYLRALSRGVWYIEQGDISRKALSIKLIRAKFGELAAEKAVCRLEELGLINDEALAERLAERYLDSNISKRAATTKMVAKGIDFALAKKSLDNIEHSPEEQIRAVIEKKYKNKLSDKENVKKVFAALQRLGFGYSDIRSVLRAYSEELEYSEENYGL